MSKSVFKINIISEDHPSTNFKSNYSLPRKEKGINKRNDHLFSLPIMLVSILLKPFKLHCAPNYKVIKSMNKK